MESDREGGEFGKRAGSPIRGRPWNFIVKELSRRVLDPSPIGLSVIVKLRSPAGQAISFTGSPSFAYSQMITVLRRYFTEEHFDALLRRQSGWTYRARYGAYSVVASMGDPSMPAPIQRCLFVRVAGPAEQRAVLVYACIPPALQFKQILAALETVLTDASLPALAPNGGDPSSGAPNGQQGTIGKAVTPRRMMTGKLDPWARFSGLLGESRSRPPGFDLPACETIRNLRRLRSRAPV